MKRMLLLLLAPLAMTACGESPTAPDGRPRFVGSYTLRIDASSSCLAGGIPRLPHLSFRWRVDATKTVAGASFSLPPAEDLHGLDAMRLDLRTDAAGVNGELAGSLRNERSEPWGYVVGFTNLGTSAVLSGPLDVSPDGRAQVLTGTLAGPITVAFYPDGLTNSVCAATNHKWSLTPI
jgi:hypothetical protein